MKKLMLLLVAIVVGMSVASARDVVTRDESVLPAAARQTVSKYYGKVGINHIKVDKKTFGGDEYDVILNNGTEIEFNSKGEINEIDCGVAEVPSGLVLKPIRDYVSKNFKGRKIVSMDVNRNSYDIELNDGCELKFDRAGRFLRIDD